MQLFLLCTLFTALAAVPWRPTPPCAAPAGIVAPAVTESMCSREVARRGDVTVREMGQPASEMLVSSAFSAPQWDEIVGYGVSSVLDYFLGDNVPNQQKYSERADDARHAPPAEIFKRHRL